MVMRLRGSAPAAFILGALLLAMGAAQARVAAKAPAAKPGRSIYDQEQDMAPAQLIARWKPLVARASHRAGVPVAWINAVMRVESGGRIMLTQTQPMVSVKGAMGLMQLLPQTYADMRAQYGLGANAFDPKDNISAGAGYLRFLRGKYGYPNLFAAYNAGPGQVDDVLGGTRALPAETRAYVARIGVILGKPGDGAMIDAVKLTQPDGIAVQIDPMAVTAVRAAIPGEYADSVQAVVQMGRRAQGVQEAVAKVVAAVRIRGGKV